MVRQHRSVVTVKLSSRQNMCRVDEFFLDNPYSCGCGSNEFFLFDNKSVWLIIADTMLNSVAVSFRWRSEILCFFCYSKSLARRVQYPNPSQVSILMIRFESSSYSRFSTYEYMRFHVKMNILLTKTTVPFILVSA